MSYAIYMDIIASIYCRYFNHLTGKKHLRPGVKRRYESEDLLEPLKQIWLGTDQMCSKRLKTAIALWLPSYESSYELLPENQNNAMTQCLPDSLQQ